MDDWKIQDTLSSIQAQMQEVERIVLRTAFDKRVSADTKRKIEVLLGDVTDRFNSLPEAK